MDVGEAALIVLVFLLFANLVVLGMRSSFNQHSLEQRLERIERRLDRISEHLGLDADLPPDVKRLRALIPQETRLGPSKNTASSTASG
ncbi:MAG TPA: hypothetical protein VJQ45_12265 [Ktedonobacterales bacterium]|nr:hypothetical protein [Ktedonobacterales bacterium]